MIGRQLAGRIAAGSADRASHAARVAASGREERLEAQLLGGHVDRRADRRHDREEAQPAPVERERTSMTGRRRGAAAASVSTAATSGRARSAATRAAVAASSTPPTASRRGARAARARPRPSCDRVADRSGLDHQVSTFAGSGTGSGAHRPPNSRAAPSFARGRSSPGPSRPPGTARAGEHRRQRVATRSSSGASSVAARYSGA